MRVSLKKNHVPHVIYLYFNCIIVRTTSYVIRQTGIHQLYNVEYCRIILSEIELVSSIDQLRNNC